MESPDLNRFVMSAVLSQLPKCSEHWQDTKVCAAELRRVFENWRGNGMNLYYALVLEESLSILEKRSEECRGLPEYFTWFLEHARSSHYSVRTTLGHLQLLGAVAQYGQETGALTAGPNLFAAAVKAIQLHQRAYHGVGSTRPGRSAARNGSQHPAARAKDDAADATRTKRLKTARRRTKAAAARRAPQQLSFAWMKSRTD